MLDNVQKTHYIEFLVTLRDPLLRGKNERWTKIFSVLKKCRRFENSHLNCVQKVHLPFKQGFQHVQKGEIGGSPLLFCCLFLGYGSGTGNTLQ